MALPTYHNVHLAAAIFVLVTLARAACFLPNGTDSNWIYKSSTGSDAYLPCRTSPDGEASMCCSLGNRDPSTCRPDGLCQSGDRIWRASCTDNTWKAKGCIRLCTDGSMGEADVTLKQCDDQSFCCDQNGSGEQCCKRGHGRWIDGDGAVVTTKPASMALSARKAATTTSVVPTTSTASSNADLPGSSGASTGVIAGGVIACIFGGFIILAGIVFIFRYQKTGKNPCPSHQSPEDPSSPTPAPIPGRSPLRVPAVRQPVTPAAK